MDTIYAPATAPGRSGVAIVRVSGPGCGEAAEALGTTLPPPRRAARRRLATTEHGVIDDALLLYFSEGASFTGEPVLEFHLHGSPAVVALVTRCLGEVAGLRLAEPGEFTRRALENGRMDLAQVEGLGDLIAAETEAQRRQAQTLMSGALGDRVAEWRTQLLRANGLIAAAIDFADEEIPAGLEADVVAAIQSVDAALGRELDGLRAAESVREGFEVAIVGPPNAGKSTLLNALAGRDAAITSEIAGTTRDVVEVRMDIGGLPVTLLDTAGLHATSDRIESLGVERALDRADGADLRVILDRAGADPFGVMPRRDDIRVVGKADLGGTGSGLAVSGLTGSGVGALLKAIASTLQGRASNPATITRERHRQAIMEARSHLGAARAHAAEPGEEELTAEELRAAVRHLEALVGRIDVEHILSEVFASFCIGK